MDEPGVETSPIGTDAEMKSLLGLFDVPAFARRGADLEYSLARLDDRCRRERATMLEMVALRLRQWAAVATGPDDALDCFDRPIDDLWPLTDSPPPAWSDRPGSRLRRRAVARDLIASIERFNLRWTRRIDAIGLEGINGQVDHYNKYYVLEKECSLGSTRLASRFFVPKARVERADLLARFPTLPTPGRRR